MLSRGVSEKVFRAGQSGGEVLWRKRSKARVAVVTDGLMCVPSAENFRLYPEYFEGCIEETLNSTLSLRKLLIFSLSR